MSNVNNTPTNLVLVPAPNTDHICKGCFYYGNAGYDCPPDDCSQEGKDYIWIVQPTSNLFTNPLFPLGTEVEKIKGSEWDGKVVGFYSTSLTPRGYAVESSVHAGSVQIYPESALRKKEK